MFTDNKAVMLLINSDDGMIRDASLGACQYYGYPLSKLTMMHIFDINTMCQAEVAAEMKLAKEEAKNHFSFRHRLATGEVRDVEVFSNIIPLEGKNFLFSIIHDVTDRKRAEEEVRRLAMTDQLTDLANRRQFQQRLEQSMKLANREGKSLALMLLDLNKFKQVNDTHGHPVGDALLIAVASILIKSNRDTDVVARLGGDEFAILVVHPEGERGVAINAQRIVDEINEPINIMGLNIQTGISIGISLYPKDAEDEEGFIKKADLALYESKGDQRSAFLFYRPEMNSE